MYSIFRVITPHYCRAFDSSLMASSLKQELLTMFLANAAKVVNKSVRMKLKKK